MPRRYWRTARAEPERAAIILCIATLIAILFSIRDVQYTITHPEEFRKPFADQTQAAELPPSLPESDDLVLPPFYYESNIKDSSNAFRNFRQNESCTVNSNDLHNSTGLQACATLPEYLAAMTSGSRPFQDGSFRPDGCDLRWYSTEQICDIMSRFARIWIVGDSLMRHVASALHLLLREDLIEGAYASWSAREQLLSHPKDERLDCRCDRAFSNGGCLFQEAWSTSQVWMHDPASMKCNGRRPPGVEFIISNSYPVEQGALNRLTEGLAMADNGRSHHDVEVAPMRPHALVIGSGLWYDLDVKVFERWATEIHELVGETLSSAYGPLRYPRSPVLAVTPSAGGPLKPHQFVDAQNNDKIKAFELEFAAWLRRRKQRRYEGRMDHLGTYNMTILNSSPDGTHAGMRADVLKAMMVVNWLDFVSR